MGNDGTGDGDTGFAAEPHGMTNDAEPQGMTNDAEPQGMTNDDQPETE